MEKLGQEIVERFINGDESSFSRIFDVFSTRIWTYFYKNTRSREVTEELVNDAFMRLWEYRANIDPQQGIRNYLYSIAKNLLYSWLRQASRDVKKKAELEQACRSELETADRSAALNASIDLKNLLQKTEELLPEKRRKVFAMSKLLGLSYAEIAVRLSISKETVKDHLSKASQSLSSLNESGDYI
eukprot:gene10533-12256_t